MYLLTKENLWEAEQRERFFHELIAKNYSRQVVKQYKYFYEMWLLPKEKDRPSRVDLGFSIRHLLAAALLKADAYGYRIHASVIGTGSYFVPFQWFAYQYISQLFGAVILAEEMRVSTVVRLSGYEVCVEISYLGKRMPLLRQPFSGLQRGGMVTLRAHLTLPSVFSGEKNTIFSYLQDRLSPVQLAFLDHSEKAASTASAVRMPSTAEEVIPPAYPAPSPQG